MKTRLLVALPLATMLSLPMVAQQTSSTPSDNQQPAATSSQPAQNNSDQGNAANGVTSSQEQGMAAHQPLQPDTRQGFWGKLNPFARKKYVQKQLAPVRNRVNELDELTAANAKSIKDVDARAQEGIRLASAKANEADQHAVDAGNRAQAAHQTATQASQRLQTVQQTVESIDQYQPASQLEIRFKAGQAVLSKQAKTALDDMASSLGNQRGYIVEVQGFAPGKGRAAVESSQRMADSVVRYLVIEHNVPVYRIYTMGMGNARPQQVSSTQGAQATPKYTRGGRVEVSLMKNSLGQLASAGSDSMPQGEGAQSAPASQTPQTTQPQ